MSFSCSSSQTVKTSRSTGSKKSRKKKNRIPDDISIAMLSKIISRPVLKCTVPPDLQNYKFGWPEVWVCLMV